MRLVVKSGGPQAYAEWRALFAALDPAIEVVDWFDPALDPRGIAYALVWEPDPGRLAGLPDLRLVISAGAGVDHILADPQRPAHVPIARMVMDATASEMSEYVLASVMHVLRDFRRIAVNQANCVWDTFDAPRSIAGTRVGVMGMGRLGTAAAQLLARTGFRVSGWSRSLSNVAGVESHAGPEGLSAFLAGTDVLVCLLPATQATRGILGAATLAQLPRGAALINAGRGMHMVEADLLAALDSGQLGQAVLDVFETEPLPADSALWRHPRITITPHCAAAPNRAMRAAHVVQLIHACERGEPLPDLYDPQAGY
ncbi:2-hydroxyacid dehydrogenase [Bordetella sp. 2513F-2]